MTEGEDLLEAGRAAAGVEPVALLTLRARARGRGGRAATCSDGVSTLGSGTRAIAVWRAGAGPTSTGALCVYLHGVADPGNVGRDRADRDALVGGHGRARARTAPIPIGRRRCGRAWARSSPSRWRAAGSRRRRRPGSPWSPTAARRTRRRSTAPRPSASAPSATGCRPSPRRLRRDADDPLRARRGRVAQRRRRGGDRPAADIVAAARRQP